MCDSHTDIDVEISGKSYCLQVSDELSASAIRALGGQPALDTRVDTLRVPKGPLWLFCCVKMLRFYRARISPLLGNRCVYEPSCSRYCELALRQHGFVRGIALTFARLIRCRPGKGGMDINHLEV